MIKFKGLIAPTEVPTGDGRMFAAGKATHRPMPIPVMAQFASGGHAGATPVATIDTIYAGPAGYWAEGEFLDPGMVPEVPKTVYFLQKKVLGPSVDLDRDYTVKSVAHPMKPDKKAGLFEEYNIIGCTFVPMPAFYQVHMSVETVEEKALLASAGVDVSMLLTPEELDSVEQHFSIDREAIVASLTAADEAECGCTDENPELSSQELVPAIGVGMGTTTNVTTGPLATSFRVDGVIPPSSITVTFGNGQFNYGYGDTHPAGPVMMEPSPSAIVKVFEDKTVVKLPDEGVKVKILNEKEDDKTGCYFNDDGHCPVCGY